MQISGNWQPLVGALFITLGAFAFYVSAFVSGRDFYRETSARTATLVSGGVGAVLFLASPLCFLLLDYTLFGFPAELGIDNYLFDILLQGLCYLVSVVGVGLTFGALMQLRARDLILGWVRNTTGTRFIIQTPGYAWDDLLLRVKPGGFIHVRTRGQEYFTGALAVYSTNNEPRELILRNAQLGTPTLEDWLMNADTNRLLLPQENGFLQVIVPQHSLKKHQDVMTHTAQALFLAISAFGVLLVSFACHQTGDYLKSNYYQSLWGFYLALSITLTLISCIILGIGFNILRQDFQRLASAFVLAPFSAILLLLVTSTVLFWAAHILGSYYGDQRTHFFLVAWGLSAGVLFYILQTCYRYHTLRRFLLIDLRSSVKEDELRDRLLSWLFLKTNLQTPVQNQYESLRKEARDHFLHDETCSSRTNTDCDFFGVLERFINNNCYLTNEHLHLAERLRSMIEQEQRRG